LDEEAIVTSGTPAGTQPAPRYVELRSDTFTLPTPQMLDAMVRAELGDDVYGEDPTVARLEALSAGLLGKEAGCFVPSGTMGNLTAIMAHCPRGAKAIVGDESDIYVYEAGGASVCGGVIYHPIPNLRDGTLELNAARGAFPPDPEDPQFAPVALLCLESPQNHSGGRILPTSYLRDAGDFARENGIALHLDGSRIFNAVIGSAIPARDIAAHADSVQFCLSKGLGAPAGSMVVGSAQFVAKVRRIRKMLGGGMRQSGVLAAAGIVALENRARLAEDNASARRLAEGLAEIPEIEIRPEEVDVNIVFFRLAAQGLDNAGFIAAAKARGISLAELGRGRIRCVTHFGVSSEDIDYTVEAIRSILGESVHRGPQPPRRSHADRQHAATH
jgi:threonine aldolase